MKSHHPRALLQRTRVLLTTLLVTLSLASTLALIAGCGDDRQGTQSGGSSESCGDGAVTSREACDDGNTEDLDGCSATCVVDPGWPRGREAHDSLTVADR